MFIASSCSPTRRVLLLLTAATATVAVLAVLPDLAAAQKGNPLETGAKNLQSTAQTVLTAVFVILIGFMALRLFAQRNFGGLAVTLLVGAVVAWIVFNPKGAGESLEQVGEAVFGVLPLLGG